jgi:hypothetical protein
METQYSEYDDEARVRENPDAAAEEPGNTPPAGGADGAAPASREASDKLTPVVRKKRASRSSTGGQARRKRPREAEIIELHVPARSVDVAGERADDAQAREELVAQGFTTDEAARIVDLSSRLGTSREARDAEASLRRLRFTRWLVERGVLDEFSA